MTASAPERADRAAPRARAGGALAGVLGGLCLWLPYALLVRRFWFVTDDSFISFRFARNLARGLGLRYNLVDGPPVEGYSNFLWVLVAAAVEGLGASVALWMPLISFACGTALLWLVHRTLRATLGLQPAVAFLAALSLACFPPFAVWSTGGLATMPFALALFVTFERLVLRRAGPHVAGAAAAAVCAALLRVEGIAWVAIVAAIALVVRRAQGEHVVRRLLAFAAIVGAVFGAYYLWRYAYYGLPLPNTAYAKGDRSLAHVLRGGRYVMIHHLTFLTPFLVLPGIAAALRPRWRWVGLGVSAMALGFPAYSMVVGGDFMAMGRFLVPGMAFNALLLGWLLETMWEGRAGARAGAVALAAATVVLGLLPGWDVHLVPRSTREVFHFRHNVKFHLSEYAQWRYMDDNCLRWKAKALGIADYAEPGSTVVAGAIGNLGYYSDLTILDKAGLVSHEVAMNAQESPRLKSPGHDKGVLSVFFLPAEPDYMELKVFTGARMLRDLKRETETWSQPAWRELYRDEYVPEFRVYPEPLDDIPPRVLLVYERAPEGADVDALWADFQARVDAYTWEELGVPRPSAEAPETTIPPSGT